MVDWVFYCGAAYVCLPHLLISYEEHRFLFGMWIILSCHKNQPKPRCAIDSAFPSTPVSMCRILFSLHPQHGPMQILVHVDVALHRKFYFAHIARQAMSVALPRPPAPYKKHLNLDLPTLAAPPTPYQ
jgi:hypothetical protein